MALAYGLREHSAPWWGRQGGRSVGLLPYLPIDQEVGRGWKWVETDRLKTYNHPLRPALQQRHLLGTKCSDTHDYRIHLLLRHTSEPLGKTKCYPHQKCCWGEIKEAIMRG